MPSARLSMDQGFTRIAPLTDGEQPTNSDTTSIEFFSAASTSCRHTHLSILDDTAHFAGDLFQTCEL